MSAPHVEREMRELNGITREVTRVRLDGRVIEAVTLDMADQWDFMEIAGRQLDNEAWVNTALLAWSVIAIDGVPIPAGARSRDDIRRILRKLGEAGIEALQSAFGTAPAPTVPEDAVGN